MKQTSRLKQLSVAIMCTLLTLPIFSKIIVWDLGFVLFEPSKAQIARHIGLWDLFCYKFAEKKNPYNLRATLFGILDNARAGEPRKITIPDDEGKPLNNIMCDYQAGVKTSEQLLEEIHATIEQLDTQGYFSSKRERKIMEKMMQTIFDPLAFARFNHPISKGVQILKQCATKKDANGNPCHEMMVLSNWDAESYAILKDLKQGQAVFKYFKPENIRISGTFGGYEHLKPHPNAFQKIIAEKKVDPSEIIFIDDQIVNIQAAQACGITAIHLPKDKNSYKDLKKQLKELDVL